MDTTVNAKDKSAQVVSDFLQALHNKQFDRLISFLAPNAEFKIMATSVLNHGANEVRKGTENWRRAFPDFKAEVVSFTSSEDGHVAIEAIAHGTHEGPLHGPSGTLEPTYKKISFPFSEFFHVSSDGKIVSWNCYWPMDVMMRQLGLPGPKLSAAA